MEQYYLFFLTYSFLGWCMESTLFSVREKRFVNRGFLNGPLCPVYGIGMVIIIYFLEPFYNNILLLFLLGMLLASILEFITGFLLEKLFKTRWWDYSKRKYNIDGYICLQNSLAWGVLCVIMIKVIQPEVVRFIDSFNSTALHTFSLATLTILIIDMIVTIANLLNLRGYITNLNIVHKTLNEIEAVSGKYRKVYKDIVDNHITLGNYLDEINEYREVEKDRVKNRINELRDKHISPRRQLKRLYHNYKVTIKNDEAGAMLAKKDLEKEKR